MRWITTHVRTLALAGGLLVAAFGLTLLGQPGSLPTAQAQEKEKHPHIRRAIEELREAKKELEKADHDFGGHRKEALKATEHAIKQLTKALEYDKK